MGKKKFDAVHRYFTYDKATEYNKCSLCGSRVKGRHTTNLKAHMASKHYSAYTKVVTLNNKLAATKQNKTAELGLVKPNPLPPKTPRPDFIILKLKILCMKLIVVHGRPLSLIGDEAFREILEMATNLAENKNEINENSVLELIPETANEIKMKIATEIKDKLLSLKIDSVTCKGRKFVGINIQYIKNDKVIIRNLGIIEIFQHETDEHVKGKITDILNDFLVPSKQIYSLVTDNGSNIKKTMETLEDTFHSNDLLENQPEEDIGYLEDEDENEEPDGSAYSDMLLLQNTFNNRHQKVRGTLCPTRTLQLAIKDSINENVNVQVTIDIARSVTKILRTAPNRDLLKITDLKVPNLDSATRWTTIYNMLIRLRSLKDFCDNIHDVTRLISVEFWDEIDQVITCLQPFYECTQILRNDQLTIGDFYINWMKCKANINSIHHPLACSLRQSMERREKTLLESDVVLEGIFLDGRLNVILSPELCEKAKDLLNQTRERLQHETNSRDTDDSNSDAPLIDIKMESEASTNADFTALEELLRESEKARGLQQHPVASFAASLQELQCRSRLPLNTNILEYYNDQLMMSRYQELAAVARTVLATPVTQMSVERMFSSLKFMLSPLRKNLGISLLQTIVFIRANHDLLD